MAVDQDQPRAGNYREHFLGFSWDLTPECSKFICLSADSVLSSACSRTCWDHSAPRWLSMVGRILLPVSRRVDCVRRQPSQVCSTSLTFT